MRISPSFPVKEGIDVVSDSVQTSALDELFTNDTEMDHRPNIWPWVDPILSADETVYVPEPA